MEPGAMDPDAPEDPAELLAEWLPANDDPVRPLMTLATVGADGVPDARSVLLTEWDEQGFWWHTDARSRKVAQLADRPAAALCLPLLTPEAARQLVVQGVVEPAPAEEERRAYAARSPYLQELAWLNTDAFAALPQDERIATWEREQRAHPEGFAQPETWIGFLVRPLRLAFWFGAPDTASRRIEYARVSPDAPWSRRTLAG